MAGPRPTTGYMGTDEPEPRYRPGAGSLQGSASMPPRSMGQRGSEDTRPIPSEVMPPEGMGYEEVGDAVMDAGAAAGLNPSDPAFIAQIRERYPDDPELQQMLDYVEGLDAARQGSDPALLGGNSPMGAPGY